MSGSPYAKHFTLDPSFVFLNHGSFGACPKRVQEFQTDLRARLERQPVAFFMTELETLADSARAELAQLLRANADDLAFVVNATAGVNTVLRSLKFEPGDELLTTNHAYNACKNALSFVADLVGAKVVIARIPFPIASSDDVVEAILAAVTPRTRIAMIDHVTSPTGLVFPIETIVARLAEKGIDTLVDGAHAPGMLDLNLDALSAAYYTGNCHKWLCAPKGTAFLHVRRDKQSQIRPLSISHAANSRRIDRSRFRLEFDWTGTADPTAILSMPEAIRTLESFLPGGLAELRERNRALALYARTTLMRALSLSNAPQPDEMIGSLVALPLPDTQGPAPTSYLSADPLQRTLREKHKIEVPVPIWPEHPKRLIRLSCQLYNTESDVNTLAQSLPTSWGHSLPPQAQ